jgi:hypothetical protein
MSYSFNPFSGKLTPTGGTPGGVGITGPQGPQGPAGPSAGSYRDWDNYYTTAQQNALRTGSTPGFGVAGDYTYDTNQPEGLNHKFFYLCITDGLWRMQDAEGDWHSSW